MGSTGWGNRHPPRRARRSAGRPWSPSGAPHHPARRHHGGRRGWQRCRRGLSASCSRLVPGVGSSPRQPERRWSTRFGTDFAVRVHADTRSTELNGPRCEPRRSPSAPTSSSVVQCPTARTARGQGLAHELAHTVQQSGSSPAVQRWSLFGKEKPGQRGEGGQGTGSGREEAPAGRTQVGHRATRHAEGTGGNDAARAGRARRHASRRRSWPKSALRLTLIKGEKTVEQAEVEAYKTTWLNASPCAPRTAAHPRNTGPRACYPQAAMIRPRGAGNLGGGGTKNSARLAGVEKAVEDVMVKELEEVERLVVEGEPRPRAEKIAEHQDLGRRRPQGGGRSGRRWARRWRLRPTTKKRIASGYQPKKKPETVEALDTVGNMARASPRSRGTSARASTSCSTTATRRRSPSANKRAAAWTASPT